METGSGCEIFSDDLDIFVALKLPNACTVLWPRIYVINVCTTFDIYVNSLEVKYIYNYIQLLQLLNQYQVEVIRVSGHSSYNEEAVEFAIDETMACNNYKQIVCNPSCRISRILWP